MLRAHRQAWAWQDEWFGLSMEDIREYERQTQVMLAKKMAGEENEDDDEEDEDRSLASDVSDIPIIKEPPVVTEQPPSAEASSDEEEEEAKSTVDRDRSQSIQLIQSKFGSKGALHSPVGSAHSFDLQVRIIHRNFVSRFQFC